MNTISLRKLNGLAGADDSYDYGYGPTGGSDSGSDSGGSSWTDWLTKAGSVVNTATGIATNVKTVFSSPSSPGGSQAPGSTSSAPIVINTQTPGGGGAAQPKGLSTGAKIGIGVGATALLGTIIYLVVPKKKK